MSGQEIIPPEPHSKGPDMRKAWAYLPRWLQAGVVLILIAVAVLILFFVK